MQLIYTNTKTKRVDNAVYYKQFDITLETCNNRYDGELYGMDGTDASTGASPSFWQI